MTVSFTFVCLTKVPYVPSMVIVDFPVAVEPLTDSVKVLEEVAGLGLNEAVTPLGSPVAVKVTS